MNDNPIKAEHKIVRKLKPYTPITETIWTNWIDHDHVYAISPQGNPVKRELRNSSKITHEEVKNKTLSFELFQWSELYICITP